MFKIGQKVVFIGEDPHVKDPGCVLPKKGEVITINGQDKIKGYHGWILKEYPRSMIGLRQFFLDSELRPLQYAGNAANEILEKFQPTEEKVDVEIIEIQEEELV